VRQSRDAAETEEAPDREANLVAANVAFAGCPGCGSALLRQREFTSDRYLATVAVAGDTIRVGDPDWITCHENVERLLGCARCGAPLADGDLVETSRDEGDEAVQELARLAESVSNAWEEKVTEPSACPHCGSARLVVEVERHVTLLAVYAIEGGYADTHDRWLEVPWTVEAAVVACGSCEKPLAAAELVAS
jgi:DNA-directed RNA polymerase subunit RPC12/RpoP